MSKVERVADRLGYDYTGRFELEPFKSHRDSMPWYYTYGIYSLDYFFDRFQPRNKYSHAAKLLIQTFYAMFYTLPIGTPLSLAGALYDALTSDTEIPDNPYRS